MPTRAHPLAGLWRADFGGPLENPNPGALGGVGEARELGVQVLMVSYDFSGAAARLVAVKVGVGGPAVIMFHALM